MEQKIFDLNLCSVKVQSSHSEILNYLADFYHGNTEDKANIEVTVLDSSETPHDSSLVSSNEFGVRCFLNKQKIFLTGSTSKDLSINARQLLRECYLKECEKLSFSLLHGSMVIGDNRIYLMIGARKSGKTTLALDAKLNHQYEMACNDHIIVLRTPDGLKLTTLPTYINVKLGSIKKFGEKILHLPSLARNKDEINNLLSDANPNYGIPYYIPPRELAMDQIKTYDLNKYANKLFIIFPTFKDSNSTPIAINNTQDVQKRLNEESRTDWVYNSKFNPTFIEYARRTKEQFSADAEETNKLLTQISNAYTFQHGGSFENLLSL